MKGESEGDAMTLPGPDDVHDAGCRCWPHVSAHKHPDFLDGARAEYQETRRQQSRAEEAEAEVERLRVLRDAAEAMWRARTEDVWPKDGSNPYGAFERALHAALEERRDEG